MGIRFVKTDEFTYRIYDGNEEVGWSTKIGPDGYDLFDSREDRLGTFVTERDTLNEIKQVARRRFAREEG